MKPNPRSESENPRTKQKLILRSERRPVHPRRCVHSVLSGVFSQADLFSWIQQQTEEDNSDTGAEEDAPRKFAA